MFLALLFSLFTFSDLIWLDSCPQINIRQDQVNSLVFGSNRPYFKQKQKNNITKFGPSGFFLIYYFLIFENKRK